MINVVMFLATYVLTMANVNLEAWLSAFYPASPFFRPWQILTYMFMHASLGHIFSNMLGLLFIGPILESTIGPKRFLSYYMLTGIGALILQYIVQAFELHSITGAFFINVSNYAPTSMADFEKIKEIYTTPILGASGAIFGLLVAVYLLYPDVEVYLYFLFPIKIKYLVPVYVIYELYSGLNPKAGDSVAHFAHIGGALVGFILIKLWGLKRQDNIYY